MFYHFKKKKKKRKEKKKSIGFSSDKLCLAIHTEFDDLHRISRSQVFYDQNRDLFFDSFPL